jgi:hypothetical protein
MKNAKNKMIEENKKALEELAAWIKNNWQLRAKMVRRSSPAAMVDMNKRRKWGPEAFFLSDTDKKRGMELAVVVYFDGETDYEVCAYPEELQRQIKWKPKPFGNRARTTFDPTILDRKFIFRNIGEFKKEFRSRF